MNHGERRLQCTVLSAGPAVSVSRSAALLHCLAMPVAERSLPLGVSLNCAQSVQPFQIYCSGKRIAHVRRSYSLAPACASNLLVLLIDSLIRLLTWHLFCQLLLQYFVPSPLLCSCCHLSTVISDTATCFTSGLTRPRTYSFPRKQQTEQTRHSRSDSVPISGLGPAFVRPECTC
jgi:hypothetical protein